MCSVFNCMQLPIIDLIRFRILIYRENLHSAYPKYNNGKWLEKRRLAVTRWMNVRWNLAHSLIFTAIVFYSDLIRLLLLALYIVS